jgi:hypothetical protein
VQRNTPSRLRQISSPLTQNSFLTVENLSSTKPKKKRRQITEKALDEHDQQILSAIYSQMSSTGN